MPRAGRHLYARGRRRPKLVVGAVVLAVAAAGVAAAVFVPSMLRTSSTGPTSSPTTPPPCVSARFAAGARLGSIAWVDAGALHLLDLDSCASSTLVATGAVPPVRFSHDGKWIAFGDGAIVAAAGGDVQHPIGAVTDWQWSPTDDALAGVTPAGGVVAGGPGQDQRVLLKDGSHAGHLAYSPDGRSLAVDAGGDRVEVLHTAGGPTAARTIYSVSPGTKAPPQVTGWSPDGRWVLFFSRFPDKAGVPLNTAPARGGNWVNVFDPVLPYDDFLSWCGGQHLTFSGGGNTTPSEDNQILVSGPQDWRYHDLSNDFGRSWFWPACSPSGRWVAATVTPTHTETPPGHGARSLWLLATDGPRRTRITGQDKAAYEDARWSADGRFLLVVRRGLDPSSPGVLLLFSVEPSTGKTRRAPGPVARIGAAPGTDGHTDWSATTDWYRP